ncbi:MAG: MFS transporter [Actinomycetaceae bacterium]|nr:MFS transporter [Actinomycetaceae bacterium]
MLKTYREILSLPGAFKFSTAGFLARFPMALMGIAQILMVSTLYGSYTLAGQVAAASVIAFAMGAPVLARLVDAFGQARVMIPSLVISGLALIGLIGAAMIHADPLWLYVFTMIGAATSGAMGSMVRSRWSGVVKSAAQLHTAFSMESTLDELVFMTGPVLATVLTTSVHPTAGLMLAVTLLVGGGLWFLSQRDTEPAPTRSTGTSSTSGSVMLQPVMIALALIYVGAGAMFGSIDVATVAFTDEFNQKSLSGVLLGIFAAGSMCAGLLYGARTWRFPLWKLFVAGVLALAVGATIIGFVSTIPLMGLVMFITGFSISPTMINVTSMVQRAVPSHRLTEGLTWMSTAMNIGVSLGAAVAGRTVDHSGSFGGFSVVIVSAWAMVVVTIVAVPVLRAASKPRRHRLPVQVGSRRLGLDKLWRFRRNLPPRTEVHAKEVDITETKPPAGPQNDCAP